MSEAQNDRSRENIRKALSLREKTSFEVSLDLSRNRTYLDDFLRGRKQSINAGFLQNLANYLRINREVLDGTQEWSADISALLPVPALSRQGQQAEAEWQAATNHVNMIMEAMSKVDKPNYKRAVQELERARDVQRTAFHRMMDAENNVLDTRYQASKEFHPDKDLVDTFLRELDLNPSHIELFRVTDNAMQKNANEGFKAGDIAVIDWMKRNYVAGGTFCIVEMNTRYIRQVEFLRQSDRQRIRCKALNPEYPDFDLDVEQVAIVGRVVAQLRAL